MRTCAVGDSVEGSLPTAKASEQKRLCGSPQRLLFHHGSRGSTRIKALHGVGFIRVHRCDPWSRLLRLHWVAAEPHGEICGFKRILSVESAALAAAACDAPRSKHHRPPRRGSSGSNGWTCAGEPDACGPKTGSLDPKTGTPARQTDTLDPKGVTPDVETGTSTGKTDACGSSPHEYHAATRGFGGKPCASDE